MERRKNNYHGHRHKFVIGSYSACCFVFWFLRKSQSGGPFSFKFWENWNFIIAHSNHVTESRSAAKAVCLIGNFPSVVVCRQASTLSVPSGCANALNSFCTRRMMFSPASNMFQLKKVERKSHQESEWERQTDQSTGDLFNWFYWNLLHSISI